MTEDDYIALAEDPELLLSLSTELNLRLQAIIDRYNKTGIVPSKIDPFSDGTPKNETEVQGPVSYTGPPPFLGVLGLLDS